MSIDSAQEHTTASEQSPAQRPHIKGHTEIKSRVLTRVATQVTAETLGVNPHNIKVSIHDDQSRLGFSLHTPLNRDDVLRCSVRKDMTLFSLCDQARKTITERTQAITGHAVGAINLIIDGVEKPRTQQRRVQ